MARLRGLALGSWKATQQSKQCLDCFLTVHLAGIPVHEQTIQFRILRPLGRGKPRGYCLLDQVQQFSLSTSSSHPAERLPFDGADQFLHAFPGAGTYPKHRHRSAIPDEA
jgi:hypothetical protein